MGRGKKFQPGSDSMCRGIAQKGLEASKEVNMAYMCLVAGQGLHGHVKYFELFFKSNREH